MWPSVTSVTRLVVTRSLLTGCQALEVSLVTLSGHRLSKWYKTGVKATDRSLLMQSSNRSLALSDRFTTGDDVCGYHSMELIQNQMLSFFGVRPHFGPKHWKYRSISSRRRSFDLKGWKSRVPISVDTLAMAGFFAPGTADRVLCFYCNGGLEEWSDGDEPWTEHAKWFPDCHFVRLNKSQAFIDACKAMTRSEDYEDKGWDTLGLRGADGWIEYARDLNAFPEAGKDISSPFNNAFTGHDVCGNECPPHQSSGIGGNNGTDSTLCTTILAKYGVRADRGRKHPEYSSLESRQRSFYLSYRWNHYGPAIWDTLAAAGFFYTGTLDLVKCFDCGGSLITWQLKDDPMAEHQTSYPDCQFVRLTRRETKIENRSPTPDLSAAAPQTSEAPTDERNTSTSEHLICKICFDRQLGAVFLPCGHQACTQCTPCLSDCHICRTTIRAIIRTYF